MLAAMMGEDMPNVVTMERTEYCCTEYSKEHFTLLDHQFSEEYLCEKELLEEWQRPASELPDGILVAGTVTNRNMGTAAELIYKAIGKTPVRGYIRVSLDEYERRVITLFDGRRVRPSDRVEVHSNGLILINGGLFANVNLYSCSGTFRGDGPYYYLQPYSDDRKVQITEELYNEYYNSMHNSN